MSDIVYDAQRAVERRVFAAAGRHAPTAPPETEADTPRAALDLQQAELAFAGTDLPSEVVMRAILSAVEGSGPGGGAFLSFWLGYELGRQS